MDGMGSVADSASHGCYQSDFACDWRLKSGRHDLYSAATPLLLTVPWATRLVNLVRQLCICNGSGRTGFEWLPSPRFLNEFQ